ncbi:MAG TPA: lipopolysaccharide assembly protein LapA domain-containing protein [Ktedonobacterales bacterium]|nr:lipopolysaccharide assembly protein LapA domain-containing protein [Ktedonobacterales bacterium]
MVSVLGCMILLFLALNHYTIQIDLIKAQYPVNVALVMLGAAAFGFVMALLLLLPGRLAAGLHVRALERDVRDLERLLVDRENLLEEQEDYLEDREELRARLIEQHEDLLARHERVLARHQALADDHDRVTAQRDEARGQLAALRIARPAASHASSAATALRLLPQTAPAPVPTPVARPSTPVPAAPVPAARRAIAVPVGRVAKPASQVVAQAKPVKQPAQQIPTPEPLRLVEPAAVVETAMETSAEAPIDTTVEAQEAVEATPTPPAPATVPVVSVAVNTPAVASSAPAPEPAAALETPVTRETQVATPTATPLARRDFAAEARAGAARVQQSAEATLARLRQNTGQIWSEATAQVSAQSKAQAARLRGLRQRVTAGLASIRNDQVTPDTAPDEPAGE